VNTEVERLKAIIRELVDECGAAYVEGWRDSANRAAAIIERSVDEDEGGDEGWQTSLCRGRVGEIAKDAEKIP